ncbi:MAG: TetR/AcrR family transcriptional regulator C-terminal domain-containing protein [Deltaproteobacteria bacterium]|nr:TetR/AcrR family transcriptional regulator C-terminal domain-containing protein [Deltaproteobacteria bacterium]
MVTRRPSTTKKKPARPREPLTRARIVAAAVALADAGGTAGLSMRGLAQALGIEAMSLYHHVAHKDALLDLMVDAIFERLAPTPDGPWRPAMRARAASIREVLLAHPWGLGLLEARKTPGLVTLSHHDRTIGRLRAAGFSIEMVAHALAVLDSYTYGFVLQELSLPFSNPDEASEVAGALIDSAPDGALPHLTELARHQVIGADYRFADEFDYGLDLVLDGIQARLTARARPTRSKRRTP